MSQKDHDEFQEILAFYSSLGLTERILGTRNFCVQEFISNEEFGKMNDSPIYLKNC